MNSGGITENSMSINSLSRFLRRFGRTVTLPTVLTVPFVLQTLTAVVLVGYFSNKHGEVAVNNLANQLRGEVSSRIDDKLDTYLAIPHQINKINLQATQQGLLNLEDFERTGRYFWSQQQVFNVGYINYGNTKGEFIGAGYEKGHVRISEKIVNQPYRIFAVDSNGNRNGVVETKPEAYPNDAAWFTEVVLKNRAIWSEIYNWQDSPDVMAISSSYPVFNRSNKFVGVIGVDLIISEINAFLREINTSKSGHTFIIERNGLLVASSSNAPPFTMRNGQAKRIVANQFANPLIKASANYLNQHFTSLNKILYPTQLDFKIGQEKYFLQISPWHDKYGLDWLIVVVMPESDFMAEIHANTHTTILLCLLTFFLAIGFGVITARWISTPIKRLSSAAQKLADKAAHNDFDINKIEPKIITHRIRELSLLADLFNQMAGKIYTAFTALETINNELETRVAEKTAQLQATQNQLLALFEAMTELIMVFDQNGKYLKIIQTQPHILYKPENELLGKTLHEIFPKSQADYFLTHIHKSLHLQKSVDIEYSLNLEAKEAWFSATISPIDKESVVFVARDISEQHAALCEREKAEIALQQALIAANSASQAKSEFLSKVSHELRTPLNVILGFTQVMVRDKSLAPEQQNNINIIHRSGNHLLQLINDVLSMSKIEAGQMILAQNNFNLSDFIQNIYEILEYKAKSKGLALIIEQNKNLPKYIKTDETKLRQILINILGNAIKFTQVGSVILRVNCNHLQTNINNDSITLLFEIEDTGAGIDTEEINSLFTPFVQTQTGRDAMEGTGLGLAISQKFVQAMGGNITIKSTRNQGSIFSFAISVELSNSESQSSNISQTRQVIGLEPNQPQYRILVVEDVAENRQILVKMLEFIGFTVRVGANGKEGIAIWESWQPHLILMDMLMPIMDGYEATRRIKGFRNEENKQENKEIFPSYPPDFQSSTPPNLQKKNIFTTGSLHFLLPRKRSTTLSSNCEERTSLQQVLPTPPIIIALTANAFEEQRDAIFAAGCDDVIHKPFQEKVLLEKIAHYLGVRYIYEPEDYQSQILQIIKNPHELISDDLSVMTDEWVQQLAQAASALNDVLVLELIEQIPATETNLIQGLKYLVDNFRLDIIFDLTQNLGVGRTNL